MQESVKHYAEGVPQFRSADPDPRQFEVRRVVVRSIASDLQMYYTAVGQTTHVATLLEQMTMPGSVLISPEQRTKRPWPLLTEISTLYDHAAQGFLNSLAVFDAMGKSSGTTRHAPR
jgi:class 3 adenylate cyclase